MTGIGSGFGIGFRPQHYRAVAEGAESLTDGPNGVDETVDWFEIVSENFMGVGGRPRRFLETLRRDFPVAMHGVGLSIGSLDPLDAGYLAMLKRLSSEIEPGLVTDYFCWTAHRHRNSHDLLPVVYTEAALNHIASRVHRVQEVLGRTIALENPSAYVVFAASDMGEAEFLAELVGRTGCKLLLDVNNLFVNTANLGYDPFAYLETLPPEAVVQFHLAGHQVNPDVRIDTHDHPVPDEVWALYAVAAARWPGAATLVEWDGDVPELPVLVEEAAKARRVAARARAAGGSADALRAAKSMLSDFPASPSQLREAGAPRSSLDELHADFFACLNEPRGIDAGSPHVELFADALPVKRQRGINVYNFAYFSRIRDVMKEDFKALALLLGDDGFDQQIAAFLLAHPSTRPTLNFVGEKLPDFLTSESRPATAKVPAHCLADVARFEYFRGICYLDPNPNGLVALDALATLPPEKWETLAVTFIPACYLIATTCDAEFLAEIAGDAAAEDEFARRPQEPHFFLAARPGEDVEILRLEPAEGRAFAALVSGQNFFAAAAAAANAEIPDEAAATAVASALVRWTSLGIVSQIS